MSLGETSLKCFITPAAEVTPLKTNEYLFLLFKCMLKKIWLKTLDFLIGNFIKTLCLTLLASGALPKSASDSFTKILFNSKDGSYSEEQMCQTSLSHSI